MSGDHTKIQAFYSRRFDNLRKEEIDAEEIDIVAGAVKRFFMSLEEPLFPFSCYDDIISLASLTDKGALIRGVRATLASLPAVNHQAAEILFAHLRKFVVVVGLAF